MAIYKPKTLTFRSLCFVVEERHDNDLASTGLAAPDRSVDAVGVEVTILFHISNKDAAVVDGEDPVCLKPLLMLNGHIAPK